MTLVAQLDQDYIVAYKAKDAVRLSVLRLLKTALKNFQVEHLRPPVDTDVLDIISRQCKQRQDSIEQYANAGRPELAAREAAEMDILRGYMPPQLEGQELEKAVRQAVIEVRASGMKDMGRVMQTLMAAHKGQVDGKAASDSVRAVLQNLG